MGSCGNIFIIARFDNTSDLKSFEANSKSKDKSTNKTNENNEVVFEDKKDEIELTDELNNARKKRRRSSASIE